MNGRKLVVDVTLWAAWVVAAATQDLPMLALVCLTALTVGIARHDWTNGVRPFTSVK